ncbi:MAG: sigma-54-dependent Fis family transcriptional regulator [Candidatus Hydrogenedentota bacterium]
MKILIVDDEPNIRRTLALYLESEGHTVKAVSNPRDAASESERSAFDMAFVDLRLGTESGLELIPTLRAVSPWTRIVVITAFATIETAVEAMRLGASDYISKPFKPDQVLLVMNRVSEIRTMEQQIAALQDDLNRLHPETIVDSDSPAMKRTLDLARKAAASEAIVLLCGESGTGKSVLARCIHQWSARAPRPLCVVSCPSLSPDLLESELFGHVKGAFTGAVRDNPGRIAGCDGGTLFLDEIGDLPKPVQSKLLRFIQDREYERVGENVTRRADVRLIVATNIDLKAAVDEGRFREDLYYRLSVIPVIVPPLRERREDIVLLAHRMLQFFASQNHKTAMRFGTKAERTLECHGWPGNVRELRNVIERAVILSTTPVIDQLDLPLAVDDNSLLHSGRQGELISLEELEESHIRRVLASTRSLQQAAEILGIDQATLYRKRKQYGI